ncbi:hypothetical protein [Bradyrhizobium sp. S3.5.5]|uniref:hypothetical protein n=1 Tax=Bradyrhizobium sp. S3.5.5 TaxID=3156430 RepID=UPI0033945048
MSKPTELAERAQMFEKRAETATDRLLRQHYREMAAYYPALSLEHREIARLQELPPAEFERLVKEGSTTPSFYNADRSTFRRVI